MEKIYNIINYLNSKKIKNTLKHLYSCIIYIMSKVTKTESKKQNWVRYQPDTTYEITCTFEDEWQGIKSTNCQNELQRLIHFNKFLQCTYLPAIKHCKYQLVVELSDPQVIEKYKYPRLHLHGIVKTLKDPEDLLKFKLNTLHNMGVFGRIQINKYRPEIWDKYMLKDQDLYGKWLKTYRSYYVKGQQHEDYEQPEEKPPKEPIDFFGVRSDL